MNVLGIVSEYNPFHNGHKKQIKEALEKSNADILICAMSGNVTQRGEFPILNKWERAEIAIKNGANLVLEIPTIFVNNSSNIFCKAGVEILEGMGVDTISFGVETNDNTKLYELSYFLKLNNPIISELFKMRSDKTISYPKFREEYVKENLGSKYVEVLKKPNNILALEYLVNMKKSHPLYIYRNDSTHNSNIHTTDIASGNMIRELLKKGEDIKDYVPKEVKELLDKNYFDIDNAYFNEIISIISKLSKDELNSFYGLEEGLGSILYNRFRYWKNYSDILEDMKSKRYVMTRITRSIMSIVLGIKKEDVNNAKLYTRVLAFDKKGSKYLKDMKNVGIPYKVITNFNKEKDELKEEENTIKFDILITDIYNHLKGLDMYKNSEFTSFPKNIEK